MKFLLVVIGLVLSVVAKEPITVNYHEEIGIPEFARIKRAEEAQDFDGSRIMGGQAVGVGAHPHLAGLIIRLTDGRTSMCGSSLLSNTKLVTAAHCWKFRDIQARLFIVVFASTHLLFGGTRVITNDVEMHPNYNSSNLNNDVAMITIKSINFNDNIRPIALATSNDDYAGTWAVFAGYGRGSSRNWHINGSKRQADLQVTTNAACTRVFDSEVVTSSTLCVITMRGQSPCNGDDGGPLSIGSGTSRTLIGIATFSTPCISSTHTVAAAFARVTSFASWIQARL